MSRSAFTCAGVHASHRITGITELAEAGAPDATLMAVAGHLSREMMEHYSHVRMAAKPEALDKLPGGLISHPEHTEKPASDKGPISGYVTECVTKREFLTGNSL